MILLKKPYIIRFDTLNIEYSEEKMQRLIEEFILKLHSEKNTSSNTEVSYKRDLTKLFIYLNNSYSTDNISDITKEELEGYISSL